MDRARILVVGSSNVDMVVTSKRIPLPGETVTGGKFAIIPGGKGANQAVAAARLGAEVTFLSRVGTDAFGDQTIEGFRREGIITDLVSRDPDRATGVALILVDEKGENSISVASGANDGITVEEIEKAASRIREADVLMLQLEIPLPAVCRAAAIAAEAGVTVILDPAPAPESALPSELIRCATILTPNETEASRLAGIPVSDAASAKLAVSRLLEAGVQFAAITLGASGVLMATRDGMEHCPSFQIVAVDSTAAGDAFNGGLATAIAEGRPVRDAIRFASAAGALAASKAGAQPSLPTRAEVDALL